MLCYALAFAVGACSADGSGDTQLEAANLSDDKEAQTVENTPLLLTYPTRPHEVFQAIGTQGKVVRDGRCLFLDTGQERLLLYFPEGQVRWQSRAGELVFNGAQIPMDVRLDIMGTRYAGKSSIPGVAEPHDCADHPKFFVAPGKIRAV